MKNILSASITIKKFFENYVKDYTILKLIVKDYTILNL